MNVVILAGGKGTRLAEETGTRPKPMVEIGSTPILWHIMQIYAHHGHRDFLVACGYLGEHIKAYFHHFFRHNNDYRVNLGDGSRELVVASGRDHLAVIDAEGKERFTTDVPFMPWKPTVDIADLDGDGRDEILTHITESWRNTGSRAKILALGSNGLRRLELDATFGSKLMPTDLDSDGRSELLVKGLGFGSWMRAQLVALGVEGTRQYELDMAIAPPVRTRSRPSRAAATLPDASTTRSAPRPCVMSCTAWSRSAGEWACRSRVSVAPSRRHRARRSGVPPMTTIRSAPAARARAQE